MSLGQIINSVLSEWNLKLVRRPKDRVCGVDYGDDVIRLLRKCQNPILFDVGANQGQSLEPFLKWFPQAHIYAFEPSPGTFEILKSKYGSDQRVTLENLGVGDREEMRELGVFKDGGENDSFLTPNWTDPNHHRVQTRLTTLDSYLNRLKIPSVDLLKIDTQGFDLRVLRGGEQSLKQRQIRVVSVELNFHEMYQGQGRYWEIIQYMDSMQYRFLGLYHGWYHQDKLCWADALFIPEGLS